MPSKAAFSPTERERLGAVVNNLSIFASQLMLQNSPDLAKRAVANLTAMMKNDEALLKRLDELAREFRDESPLRVMDDLARLPTDIVQTATFVRRCLLALAFLGHCIAQPILPTIAPQAEAAQRRLH